MSLLEVSHRLTFILIYSRPTLFIRISVIIANTDSTVVHNAPRKTIHSILEYCDSIALSTDFHISRKDIIRIGVTSQVIC